MMRIICHGGCSAADGVDEADEGDPAAGGGVVWGGGEAECKLKSLRGRGDSVGFLGRGAI
jgi:hypothetical protein